jgi:hypothetical protein
MFRPPFSGPLAVALNFEDLSVFFTAPTVQRDLSMASCSINVIRPYHGDLSHLKDYVGF